jgi:hypothetical protein|nr:MAG TPA: Flagellar and Swarming motility protein [Caudoviricetes sp.]
MFIRLTFNHSVLYVSSKHIQAIKPFMDHTQIRLSDGEIIKVNESGDKILKLIEAVHGHGNQAYIANDL